MITSDPISGGAEAEAIRWWKFYVGFRVEFEEAHREGKESVNIEETEITKCFVGSWDFENIV